jgi:hypothetical protein
MPTYLVSPSEPVDWRDDPASFASAFVERWPGAEITEEEGDESPMALSFELKDGDDWVLGRLHGDGQAVEVDTDVGAAAEVAAWWRERVPAEVGLVFYDEGFNRDVPVPPGVDGAALASAYLDG